MALPPLAPVSDLEVALGVEVGSIAGTDLARARRDLDVASAFVRDESLGVSWVDVDGVTITAPASVVAVTVKAAQRAYLNPEGLTSESFGGAYSYQRDQTATSALLTGDEIRVVQRAARAVKRLGSSWTGTGTIRTPSAYRSTGSTAWEDGVLPL